MSAGRAATIRGVREAQVEFDAAQSALLTRVGAVKKSLHNRPGIWLTGGFLAGGVVGFSRHAQAWIGSVLGQSGVLLARSLITPALMGRLRSKQAPGGSHT